MNTENLLIEIGVEEIPAESIGIAIQYLENSFRDLVREAGLPFGVIKVYSTPRRLALCVTDLARYQEDKVIVKMGPSVSIAFTEDGKLSPAGMGFLKKCGASQNDLYREETDKGTVIAVKQEIIGKETTELVSTWFSAMIKSIPFPRKMIWNESKGGFIRPLRWILGLYGNDLLPLSAMGIDSGRISYGNRWLGLGNKVEISTPLDYEACLETVKVSSNRELRRADIVRQLKTVTLPEGCVVQEDERLVDTVTDLVEFPTAVVAEFDESFLVLPDKIITSTISQNQKYFSVLESSGRLSNKFVFISNGDPRHSELIRRGNEKVVRARLADAMWYYREDLKTPLEDFIPNLKDVVFHAKLGTVADKTDRIIKLAEYISTILEFNADQQQKISRAASLCKTDLVTTMLGEKEFTKLQGYVGKQYALAGGEDKEVAEAICEHYQPKGQGDSLPQTVSGAVVAIADKLDTVCGIIGIGMLPTGSGDPYALRRAAGGIVQILADRAWNLDLYQLIAKAIESLKANPNLKTEAYEQVKTFLNQRVKWLLQQFNLDYDVIESVMHVDMSHVPDIAHRAKALQNYRSHEDFIRLVVGFKRVANIIAGETGFTALDRELLTDKAEVSLYEKLLVLRQDIDASLEFHDYEKTITFLINYGVEIDTFFNEVLVNTDADAVRLNRYSLLAMIKQEFLRVADLSLLVIE